MPATLDDIGNDFINDDDDLEAELIALTSGDDNVEKSRRTGK